MQTWGVNSLYVGRGCKRLGLPPSTWGNPFKVAEHGRCKAIQLFKQHVTDSPLLLSKLGELTILTTDAGKRKSFLAEIDNLLDDGFYATGGNM